MADASYGNNPDFAYARSMRKVFNTIKQTPQFKTWRRTQYKIQGGKCAWCERPMNRQLRNIHVDHALALFHGGRNDYDNLVLSHGRCNVKKWIRIDAVPQWIINAKVTHYRNLELDALRAEQERIYRQGVLEDLDDKLLSWMNTWI